MSFDNPQDQQNLRAWLQHQVLRLKNGEVQTVIQEINSALGIIEQDQQEHNITVTEPTLIEAEVVETSRCEYYHTRLDTAYTCKGCGEKIE